MPIYCINCGALDSLAQAIATKGAMVAAGLVGHGGANDSGGPPGERNLQYRHGERTKAAIAERQKFSALLKMLRAGLM